MSRPGSRSSLRSSTSGRSSSDAAFLEAGSAGALPPLLYVCISCEGVVRAERVLPEVAATSVAALRNAAVKAERCLQRQISFASKEERLPRGSRCSIDAIRLPATLTAHVLRRHGHSFTVLALPGLEAELASRFCEAACALYGAEILAHAQSPGGGSPGPPGADDPPSLASSSSGGARSGAAGSSSASRSSSRWSWRRASRVADELPYAARLGESLELLLREHSSPERLMRLRRVAAVADATREVAGVVEESIERMLATGQNLDALEDKSEWLLAQATAFKRSATTQRRRMCWLNFKLGMLIGIPIVLAIAVGTILVLQYTGIITLWPHHSSSNTTVSIA